MQVARGLFPVGLIDEVVEIGIWLLTGQPGVPGATEPVPWQ